MQTPGIIVRHCALGHNNLIVRLKAPARIRKYVCVIHFFQSKQAWNNC